MRRVTPWALALAISAVGCSKDEEVALSAASATASAAAEGPHLPAPFRSVRLGMTEAQLDARYPPAEEECAVELVGVARAEPAGSGRRRRCVTIDDVAGLTRQERAAVQTAAEAVEPLDEERRALMVEALVLTAAQLRGAVRSGHLAAGAIAAVTDGVAPEERLVTAAVKLVEGATAFARDERSRRVLGAVFAEDCSGVDPVALREYLAGEMTLDDIDERSQKRVGSGPCKANYVRHEKVIRRQFVALTGALAGVGLARAGLEEEERLDPDDQASFTAYSTRSRLDAPLAALGVRLALALPNVEATFAKGWVLASGDAKAPFRDAIIWFAGGKLDRVVVNLPVTEGYPQAKRAFDAMYGAATSDGTGLKWSLPGGAGTARLDFGVPMALRVAARGLSP